MNALLKMKSALTRFSRNQSGTIAMVAAITAIPMLVAGGAAVDIERAINARTSLQSSLDSAALYAATLTDTTDTALTTNSQIYLTNNYANNKDATISGYSVVNNGTTITATAKVTLNTTFMNLVGIKTMTVTSASTVTKQGAKLEVAVVLDNTGSMKDNGKITAEITASTNLLNQLKGLAKQPTDVYMSLVPFDTTVNVGTSTPTANWLDWGVNGICNTTTTKVVTVTAVSTTKAGKVTTTVTGPTTTNSSATSTTTQAGCTSAAATNTNNTVNTKSGTTNIATTTNTKITPVAIFTAPEPANVGTWKGCVTDRGTPGGPSSLNYDTNVVAPTSTDSSSQYSVVYGTTAFSNGKCPPTTMGLSNDWTGMQSVINSMVPMGSTNQNIGLQMGWMSLTGGGPYSIPALDPDATYTKAVVLLTDGLNTYDRWYSNQTSIDNRQKLTCANMKAAGVVVYAVQIDIGSVDGQSSLLKTCVTDSAKYFYLTNATAAITAFQSIGNDLAQMYLSQ